MEFSLRKNEKEPKLPNGAKQTTSLQPQGTESNEVSRAPVYGFAVLMLLLGCAIGGAIAWSLALPSFFATACIVVVGALAMYSFRLSLQWEKAVVTRFGKFNRVTEPGLYFLIPFVDAVANHVDQRIQVSSFSAEEALTADLVPVDIDAVLLWMVWDAKAACLEVSDYPKAVIWSAQTAMRTALGQVSIAELSSRRAQINRDLQKVLAEKCEQWGIAMLSVEIRNITIPKELQDAMSKEAQAERERNARIVLAEVEKDISEMYVEAAEVYDRNPTAVKLRAMNLAYESAKDGNGVILAPSSLAEGLNLDKILK